MRYSARDLSIGGLFGALGIIFPFLFHFVGQGAVFLPMHLPILVCGLLVSAPVALAVGIVTPVVSAFLTGMPPLIPIAALMTLELGALAAVASICYRRLRLPLILSIIVAMIAARLVGGLERVIIAPFLGLEQSVVVYLSASVLVSWPGIVLQLVCVPVIMKAISAMSPSVNVRPTHERK